MSRPDAIGLVAGAACVALAVLGLGVSFAPVARTVLGVAIPIALVFVGAVGLLASRPGF